MVNAISSWITTSMYLAIVIAITLYSSSHLGKDAEKRPFDPQVKLPPAQCPRFYHKRRRFYTVPLIAYRQPRKL